ncbi:MAG TPA: hypothetical protein VEK73_21270 [Xanthobacteraceae bacterium]|nr:hypothetical protein [Xanthobacteraceae bacterium]
MTVLAATQPAPALAVYRACLIEANINPVTGLATDYLNHFNEAIMMLELAPQMPDCIADLCAWRPLSYREHFAASNFKGRELAIAAYDLADPALRRRLDALADDMTAVLLATAAAMARAEPQVLSALAEEALARLRPLVARAGAVIHGAETATAETADADATRAAVAALFEG